MCIPTMLDQGCVDHVVPLGMLLRAHVSDVLVRVVDLRTSEDQKELWFWTDKECHGRVSER